MEQPTVFSRLVEAAGGLTKLKDALGEESVQTVSNWRHRGIPANRCKAIERLYGISVRDTRPDDWRQYWPEDDTPEPTPPAAQEAAA